MDESSSRPEQVMSSSYDEVVKMLKANDIDKKFSRDDRETIRFFQNPDKLKALLEVIANPDNYYLSKKVFQFFQSSDTSVIEIFATQKAITEYAISFIDQLEEYPLAIGVFSRILGRAFCSCTDGLSDIFRSSKVIVPTIIRLFDRQSVFQATSDEIGTSQYKGVPHFIWALTQAIAGEYTEKLKPYVPEYIEFFSAPPYKNDFNLTPAHYTNITNVIKLYYNYFAKNSYIPFELGLQCKTFNNYLIEMINMSLSDIPPEDTKNQKLVFFDLAASLTYSPAIEKLAVKFTLAAIEKGEIINEAMEYLAKYNSNTDISTASKVLNFISTNQLPNIVFAKSVHFIKAVSAKNSTEEFGKELMDLIQKYWDSSTRKIKTLFVEVASSLKEGSKNSVSKVFLETVVYPYISVDGYDECIPQWDSLVSSFI